MERALDFKGRINARDDGTRPTTGPRVDPGSIDAARYPNDEAINGLGNCPMNEIRPVTGEAPLSVEVELVDSPPPDPTTPDDLAAHEPDEAGPGPAFEPRRVDRRVAQRYRTKEGRCWVGWKDAVGFQQTAGWMIDISASGSLIAVDVPPPTDRSVWIRLDDPAVPEWAEARVIGIQSGNARVQAVRVVFRDVCPYAIIKAAVFASGPGPARPSPSASSWHLNSW